MRGVRAFWYNVPNAEGSQTNPSSSPMDGVTTIDGNCCPNT